MRQEASEETQDGSTEQRREQSTFPELQGRGEDASAENTGNQAFLVSLENSEKTLKVILNFPHAMLFTN